MEPIKEIYEALKIKVINAGFVEEDLIIEQLKDGTYNFMYEDIQIGRIKFGKKSSKMQILTNNDITWIENKTLDTYIAYLDKWIEYIKEINSITENYNIS